MFLGAFGKLGSYVILFVLFLAGLVLTLGRAILTPLGLKSREVAYAIKDETRRYRAESEERRLIAERRSEERLMRRAEEREAKAREAEANRNEILKELDARMEARKRLQKENTIRLDAVRTETPAAAPKGISDRISDTFLGTAGKSKKAESGTGKTAEKAAAKPADGQMSLDLDPKKELGGAPVLPAGAKLDQLLKEMDEHAVSVQKENRTLSELDELEEVKSSPKISRKPFLKPADTSARRGVTIYEPAAEKKEDRPAEETVPQDDFRELLNSPEEAAERRPDLDAAFSEYERSKEAAKSAVKKPASLRRPAPLTELEETLQNTDLLDLSDKPADAVADKPASAPAAAEPEAEPSWEDPREQLKKIRDDSIFRQESDKNTSGNQGRVLSRPASEASRKSSPGYQQASLPLSSSGLPDPKEPPKKEYKLPNINLLTRGKSGNTIQESTLQQTADLLEETLRNFGVEVSVTDVSCGPSVIRYELKPEMGVKVSRISALADDIKLALAAAEIRIEAPIPGKSAVGIEVPNPEKQTVYLRTILESEAFNRLSSKIAFAVGQDIGGQIIVADLAKMPHLLVAGTTGSGKSVFLNSLILSILYRAKPEEVQMIMVDPKKVELVDYNGIPHLRIPVVTEPNLAADALNGAVKEMTGRYKKFADLNVRDIKSYNAKIRENPEEYSDREILPQIVIIVDEFADLMMTASKDVEQAVVRLAQLARAAGIHLVIATQRPTANVITGLIKSNIQSRVALTVASGLDSRTILDMNGAEKLLGHGDMLFYPTGYAKPIRVQGCWVTDQEIEAVTNFWKKQGAVTEEEMKKQSYTWMNDPVERENPVEDERDEMFLKAAEYIIDSEKASIGNLQRVFRIGFNRAARIMDQLADAGIVGKDEGTKARQIMLDRGQFEDWKRDNGY
ncbi:MAG: DNA translocase FtsK [Lachnospiraceae bacterium]|nr:DNA translocase FtsK [Lachnospiraceae bacterium]